MSGFIPGNSMLTPEEKFNDLHAIGELRVLAPESGLRFILRLKRWGGATGYGCFALSGERIKPFVMLSPEDAMEWLATLEICP